MLATGDTSIDMIKKTAVSKLEQVLKCLNKTPPKWCVKDSLKCDRVKTSLALEIDEPHTIPAGDYNYSPLLTKGEYSVIVYQLAIGGSISFGILKSEPGIETFLEASVPNIVEWIIPSQVSTEIQRKAVKELDAFIETATALG